MECFWRLRCPACGVDGPPLATPRQIAQDPGAASRTCAACQAPLRAEAGIWRCLPAPRAAYYAGFLDNYTAIRQAEGRGSVDIAYYHRLPETLPDDPMAWAWRIRAKSYAALVRHVIRKPNARLLDIGAGNAWLSARLRATGHQPCSVDINLDPADGLAAARHYDPDWPLVEAEFDALPLAPAQADFVVFNASFHYSTDYDATLREARRVLAPGGAVIVLDTPVYRREASGLQMIAERTRDFERRYGRRSDDLPSKQFLTWKSLAALAECHKFSLRVYRPWYGWQWALRPWKARLRGEREPSRFAVLVLQS